MDTSQWNRIDVFDITAGTIGSLGAWCARGEQALGQLLLDGTKRIGLVWEEAFGRCCCLHDLEPAPNPADPSAQFRTLFDAIQHGLAQAGMRPEHLVRTWFLLNPILPHYAEFNRVRSERFHAWGLDAQSVPASTAVGGHAASRARIAAGVLAVIPRRGETQIGPVSSPLQGTAIAYGSAFSRATKLQGASSKHLLVSGTASIDPGGASLFLGDTPNQVDQTLAVVAAILAANDFGWSDVVDAIAYFRRSEDTRLFEAVRSCAPTARLHVALAEVCRDELWFELELEAARRC